MLHHSIRLLQSFPESRTKIVRCTWLRSELGSLSCYCMFIIENLKPRHHWRVVGLHHIRSTRINDECIYLFDVLCMFVYSRMYSYI
jgi:hypothetical protein